MTYGKISGCGKGAKTPAAEVLGWAEHNVNLTPLEANSSIRISISKYTTEQEINYVLDKIQKVVIKLRRLSPLVK